MPSNVEGGVRRTEYYYAREVLDSEANPITPTDPAWQMYSSVIESSEGESSANYEERTGVGVVDPVDKNRKQESHELTVNYDLEQFPVDGNGDPQDAFADAALRDIDNRIKNTHSYLEVEKKATLVSTNTVHHKYFDEDERTHPQGETAATSKGTRIVTYGEGGFPSEPSLSVDPGDSAVIKVEIPYTFRKTRKFQIDQPESDSYLHLRSTDPTDTGESIELEAVGAGTTESVTLDAGDATTIVPTTGTFTDLRAVNVPDSVSGTIEVFSDDGSGSGSAGAPDQLLTIVYGPVEFDGVEGDGGVPLLGAGSKGTGSNLGTARTALGRELVWTGDPAAEKIMSTTITVTNNLEETETTQGLGLDIRSGSRDVGAESTVFGETETHDKLSDHLRGVEGELKLVMQGGEVVLPRAYVPSGGSATKESEQAFMSTGVQWTALKPSGGGEALQFVSN